MRKLLLFLLTNCCILAASWSQQIDFENFTTLKSVGKIPEDFTTLASTKFKEDAAEIEGESRREKADKETFLLESNFLINEMLHSGRVIFGDPVTNYLNQIKAEILKANPELDDDIRIYTLLSNDVNAFTADNGIVLVTTGLVAQAQNEAEIAFILCHEFSHFYKKHAIDNYVENRKIERGVGVYSSLDNDAVDLEKFKYSKDLETEADVVGLSYFKNTKYSLNAAENVFDVLLYSYLPFNEITFPT
jgi:predicted Zn-dependent protease